MKNERLRNRDLIAMHLRPGGGRHGGTGRARRRRDRQTAKRELDALRGGTREAARD